MSDEVISLKIDTSQVVDAYKAMAEASARASEAQSKFTAVMASSARGIDGSASSAAVLAQNSARVSVEAKTASDSHTRFASALGATSAHLDGVASKLDFLGKTAGVASTGLDAIGFVPAGVGVAEMSSKLEAAATVFGAAGSVAGHFSDSLGGVSSASAEATEALRESNEETGSSAVKYITAAAAASLFIGVVYAGYRVLKFGAEAARDGANAVIAWTESVTGAAAVEAARSDASRAAFEAQVDLNREIGIGVESVALLGDVTKNYGVSQSSATSAMRQLVEVLNGDTDKTHAARVALESYIGSLDGMTGKDWASVIDKIARSMDGYADSTRKTAAINVILGQHGSEFLKGIASGAAEANHIIPEVQNNVTALDQLIADSKKRILATDQRTWFNKISDDISSAISRGEVFKSEQILAAGEVSVAWNEYIAGVGTLSTQWSNATKAASDYVQVIAHGIAPETFSAPELPKPSIDNRPSAPTDATEQKHLIAQVQQSISAIRETWEGSQAELNIIEIHKWQDLVNSGKVGGEQLLQVQQSLKSSQIRLHREAGSEAVAAAHDSLSAERADHLMTQGQVLSSQIEADQRLLADSRLTADQRQQVERDLTSAKIQLNDLQKAAADQAAAASEQARQKDLSGQMRALQEQSDASRNGSDERIDLTIKEVEFAYESWGVMSQQYKMALGRMLQADHEYTAESRKSQELDISREASDKSSEIAVQEENLSFGKSMGTMGGVDEIASARSIANAKFDIEKERLEKTRALEATSENDKRDIDNQLIALEQQRALKMLKIDHQESLSRKAEIQSWTAPIGSAMNSMIVGYMQGTQTLSQIAAKSAQAIAVSYAQKAAGTVADWAQQHLLMAAIDSLFGKKAVAQTVATETAKKTAVTAGNLAQTASMQAHSLASVGIVTSGVAQEGLAVQAGEIFKMQSIAAGAEEGLLTKAASAVKSIAISAYEAAAGAYASVASIPFVGWALAPAVAAGALAAVIGFGARIASAEGGWGEVDQDGRQTILHKQEMVLPAKYATPLRDMLTGGGVTSFAANASGNVAAPANMASSVSANAGFPASLSRPVNSGSVSTTTQTSGDTNLHYSPTIHSGGSPSLDKLLQQQGGAMIRFLKTQHRNGMFK